MNLSIYIQTKFYGNPIGQGKAVALLEYIGTSGHVYTKLEIVKQEKGTKNALILKTCVKALEHVNKPCSIIIYVDCPYIQGTLNRRLLEQWKQQDWKRATGQSPANLSDWKKMYNLLGFHQIKIKKYKDKYTQEIKSVLEGKEL